MPSLHRECYLLSDYYYYYYYYYIIDVEEIAIISGFCWVAETDLHRLARPKNVKG